MRSFVARNEVSHRCPLGMRVSQELPTHLSTTQRSVSAGRAVHLAEAAGPASRGLSAAGRVRGNLGTVVGALCPRYTGRVDEGEDDVLGERGPGRAKACEPGVNRCQIVHIDAWVALLRRCR